MGKPSSACARPSVSSISASSARSSPLFEPYGFLRISREVAVNLHRIRDIRLRPSGRDWEVKLEPPVNKVLPVSRALLSTLWEAFG